MALAGAAPEFEKPPLAVEDEAAFLTVKNAVERAFASEHVAKFLRSVRSSGLRARAFEAVLTRGLFGADAAGQYQQLGNSDQGQIREFYLSQVEQVAPDLRAKFLKIYAYY